jgi:hypothetical protein
MEISMGFLKKLKIDLPYDPTTPLSDTRVKDGGQHAIETPAHPGFRQRRSQQSGCGISPLRDEWIKKIWYVYTI